MLTKKQEYSIINIMDSLERKRRWKVNKAKKLADLKIEKIQVKCAIKASKKEVTAKRKIEKVEHKLEHKLEKIRQKYQKKRRKNDEAKVIPKHRHLATIRMPSYSLTEELINSISHGLAAIAAIVALVLCVLKAETPVAVISSVIYGGIMIVLYIFSCIYHALSANLLGKKVLRIIDHINVMLMVAGTYTPICLSLIGGSLGWILFAIVWCITILAVVFNAIHVDKAEKFSVACTLVLGWGVLLVLPQLLERAPLSGILAFLVGGGVVYSIGSIIYRIGAKKKYMHCIFHFFVIVASVLHFFFIYLYCI